MEPKRCLVLLPIGVTLRQEGPTFLAIYQHILLPALHATGIPLAIFRGDEVLRAGLTLHDGRLWVQDPHLVLADLTTAHSGVLHDLRLRHDQADRTILLSQRTEDVPPQFAAYRQILYSLSEAGITQLYHDIYVYVHAILCPAAPRTEAALSSLTSAPGESTGMTAIPGGYLPGQRDYLGNNADGACDTHH